MKTFALSCSLIACCGLAQAQEVGQVLSRTAVYQQVAVPRQSCAQTVTPNAPTSGAGAVSGAVTGAVLGTIIGEGRGAGALIGAVGGAIVGDRAESNANSQPMTTCTTQTFMENRLVGYNVVYEYAGKTYNVQLPQDPGPTLALQIAPAGLQSPIAPAIGASTTVITQPSVVYTQPSVVYAQPPVVYAPAPYYRPWPVTTSINLGWGWYGGGHRHWR
jgi:uncharacterized protein YcfJ